LQACQRALELIGVLAMSLNLPNGCHVFRVIDLLWTSVRGSTYVFLVAPGREDGATQKLNCSAKVIDQSDFLKAKSGEDWIYVLFAMTAWILIVILLLVYSS
jgi:hypothetical protein